MSREERLGFRDETYSRWHRALPLELDFVDLDWMELCATCHEILAVYELARDTGQETKDAWATRRLARRANVRGYVVLYAADGGRITGFRVRKVWPSEERAFTSFTEEAWVRELRRMRCHEVQPTPTRPERQAVPVVAGTVRVCPACKQSHPWGVNCLGLVG